MNIIIYGAGLEGEKAYNTLMLFPENNILFFVDKDENKQRIGKFCGHDVYPLSKLADYVESNVRVVVTPKDAYVEICNYLNKLGFKDIVGLGGTEGNDLRRKHYWYDVLNHERCIDLGAFFSQCDFSIKLPQIPFVNGGSGVMDYAFLLVLAKKLNLKTYLEIGTYIGTSINIMSSICERCYGITAPIGAPYSMREWCRARNIPDYSSALTQKDNIRMFYANSREFDFSLIDDDIDLFFIDGDHSYNGVFCDTINIFKIKKESAIVVWHDFSQKDNGDDVILAVKDAIGNEFDNVYVTDNNICGIYLPEQFKNILPKTVREFKESQNQELYVYDVEIKPSKVTID